MKGRTSCPKCKHDFEVEVTDDKEQHEVVCPKCENKFKIDTKNKECGPDEECSWEEHGEPRKTVLSSIKPKTNKPMMATILLIVVFSIGISTAALSEAFIESSLDIASAAGMDGTVVLTINDQNNKSIDDATIRINNELTKFTGENGIYIANNVELGIQVFEVCTEEFNNQSFELLVTPFFNSESNIVLENSTATAELKEFDTAICSMVLIIFSIFPILAAVVCFKRQHFDIALVGSILGIFSFGFFLTGSIISFVALYIIWKSRDEFENGKKGKTF